MAGLTKIERELKPWKEYPSYGITIDIKDGKGVSYELNYDDADVIDA